jgi:hypothetical protein
MTVPSKLEPYRLSFDFEKKFIEFGVEIKRWQV